MTTQTIYKMSDKEYNLFKEATLGIQCPDLSDHNCDRCPLFIDINWDRPLNGDFHCLLAMMERTLTNLK